MFRIILTSFSRGITASSSMLLTLVLASHVHPASLGVFFVAQSVILLVTQFTRFGIDRTIIMRNARRKPERTVVHVFELLLFMIVAGGVSVVVAAGLMVCAPLLVGFYGEEVALMSAKLAPAVPALTTVFLVAAWLKSEQRPEISVFFEIGGVNIIMMLVFVVFRDLASLFILSSYVLVALAMMPLGRRAIRLMRKPGIVRHATKALLRVRLDISLGSLNILLFMGINMSVLLGGMLLEPHEVAQLRIAERVASAVAFPLIVQGSILPTRFAREVRQTGRFCLRSYAPQALVCTSMSTAIALATIVAYATHVIGPANEAYKEWFGIWGIFAGAYFISAIIGPTESVAAAVGYGRNISIITGVWLAVYAAAAAFFASKLGTSAIGFGFALYVLGVRLSALALVWHHLFLSKAEKTIA